MGGGWAWNQAKKAQEKYGSLGQTGGERPETQTNVGSAGSACELVDEASRLDKEADGVKQSGKRKIRSEGCSSWKGGNFSVNC